MTFPSLSLPTAPSLLTLLTPAVAAPVEPGAVDFATVIARLGETAPVPQATLPGAAAADLPITAPVSDISGKDDAVSGGNPMPPDRPILAAAPPPNPILAVQAAIRTDGSTPRIDFAIAQPVAEEPEAAPLPRCEVAILPRWTLAKSVAQTPAPARAAAPATPRLAAEPIILPDLAAGSSDLPAAIEPRTEDEAPLAQAEGPPSPPTIQLPSFTPLQWTAPAPEPVPDTILATAAVPAASIGLAVPGAPVSNQPIPVATPAPFAAPPLAFAEPQSLPAPAAAPVAPQLAPAQAMALRQPEALPATPLVLPPEIARQIAQMVPAVFAEEPAEAAPSVDAPAPIAQPAAVSTAAPAFVAQPPLGLVDTGRAQWMQAMIEHIADIAQADGKREAQIRLLPDSLGAIEVKIEQRQDRMHVTLVSENAQTRQLLADAAPRLQELAEARGLRFAQTGIGGGDAQDRRSNPEQPQPRFPDRPASALAEEDDEPTGDLIA